MADIIITPADVDLVSGSQRTGEAGVAIAAGEVVYVDSAGLVQLCQNDVSATEAAAVGIALSSASANQPVTYQISGVIDIGATLVVGEVYVVSATGGGIAPVADIVATNFATVLGVAIGTNTLKIGINQSGVAAA